MVLSSETRGNRRVRRWVLACVALLLVSAGIFGCLPMLLSSRWVWPRLLATVSADLDGTVTTGGVHLQWFAPVQVDNVRIADAAGTPIATVKTVRTEKTLLSLLLSGDRFGRVHIERPEVRVRVRRKGSNVEDLLATYLSSPSSASAVEGTLEISEGTLIAESTGAGGNKARWTGIHAEVALGEKGPGTGTMTMDRCQQVGSAPAGTMTAAVTWNPAETAAEWSAGVRAEALDLAALNHVFERLDLDVHPQGVVSADVQLAQRGDEQTELSVGHLSIAHLRLAAPDLLGTDILALDTLEADGAIQLADDRWHVTEAALACDVGRLAADGSFRWPQRTTADLWGQLAGVLQADQLRVTGHLDLAQLATILPHTLHVRQGAVIQSGSVDFALQGANNSGTRHWQAELATSAWTALRAGRQYTWKAPLRVTLKARQSSGTWLLEQLVCTSSFLSITGQGSPGAGNLAMQCNLQRLAEQVQEFVDLGSLSATGTVAARLQWQESETGQLAIDGSGRLEKLDIGQPSFGHWQEPALDVRLAGRVTRAGQDVRRVENGQLTATMGSDQLVIDLLEPVAQPWATASWVVGCRIHGQSATWFQRLRPLLAASGSSAEVTVAGPVELEATLRISPHRLEVERGSLACEPFLLDMPQIHIDEPAIAIEVEGQWEYDQGRWRIPEATFQSLALAFRLVDVRSDRRGVHAAPNAAPRVTGDVTFRADLDRLFRSWRLVGRQRDWRLSGAAEGQLSLVQTADLAQLRWTLGLSQLDLGRRQPTAAAGRVAPATAASPWITVWHEPTLRVDGAGQWDWNVHTIQLDRFEMTAADKLQLSLRGRVEEPTGTCQVDLQGQVTYDLAKLWRHWAGDLAQQVQWSGRDTQAFSLRGPLFHQATERTTLVARQDVAQPTAGMIPAELTGETGIRWQAADLFGFAIGAGTLAARLEAGTIRTGRLEFPVSEGLLRMEPTVYLNAHPPMASIASGQVLSNIQITQTMCDQWLKYVTPIAAEATRAQGAFSLELKQGTIPLRDPSDCRVEAALEVHDARLGPGPLAQQLILTADAAQSLLRLNIGQLNALGSGSWVRIPQQRVGVWVVERRVYHDRLMFQAGPVAMATRGSVGFDQSLSIVAEIPIQDAWIDQKPQLRALRGQVLQLPISGTLADPRVDRRALDRLVADSLQRVTGQVLENELQRGLQQLFGPGQ